MARGPLRRGDQCIRIGIRPTLVTVVRVALVQVAVVRIPFNTVTVLKPSYDSQECLSLKASDNFSKKTGQETIFE